jgi:hypothetical protein
MTHAILQLFHGKVEPLKGYERYSDIGFRVMDRLLLLKQSYFMPLFQAGVIESVLVCVLLLIATVLVIKKILKKRKLAEFELEFLFVFLIPIFYFAVYVFYPFPLWAHYILPLTVVSALLLALCVKKVSSNRSGYIFSILFMCVISLSALNSIRTYYFTNTQYTAVSDGSYLNQLHAADTVFQDAHGKSFGYFVYHQAVFTYSMDYLLWWLGDTKYHTTFSNQKQELTYLIMYAGQVNDLRAHDFWKKNVVRTKAIPNMKKVLPGEITIERLSLTGKEEAPDPNYYQNLMFR